VFPEKCQPFGQTVMPAIALNFYSIPVICFNTFLNGNVHLTPKKYWFLLLLDSFCFIIFYYYKVLQGWVKKLNTCFLVHYNFSCK